MSNKWTKTNRHSKSGLLMWLCEGLNSVLHLWIGPSEWNVLNPIIKCLSSKWWKFKFNSGKYISLALTLKGLLHILFKWLDIEFVNTFNRFKYCSTVVHYTDIDIIIICLACDRIWYVNFMTCSLLEDLGIPL